jgi:hypothetical protein
MKTN